MVSSTSSPVKTTYVDTSDSSDTESLVSARSTSSKSINVPACKPTPVDEDSFARTQTTFWSTLEAGDAKGISTQLQALAPAARSRLANSPKSSVDFEPKLPLCVAAAHGSIALMRALLQPSAAVPLAGETCDDLVLTALYWAARYGVADSMNFLHDGYGIPSSQVLLACEESATQQLVVWLKKHGISGENLDHAMQHAVERDDMDSIVNLTKFGKGRVDIVASEDLEEDATLLSYAIANGKLAAASALIDAGANANGQRNDHKPAQKQQPIWLAIAGHHVGLVRRLLAAGAICGVDHLKHALSQGSPSPGLYVALTDNDVAPRTQAEAKDLQRLAIACGNLELIGLVTAQKTMLERQSAGNSEGRSLRKDDAYKFALDQVSHAAKALRETPEGGVAVPMGVAILTDSKPLTRKPQGFAKLTRAFKPKLSANSSQDRSLQLATRRHER